MAFSTAYSAWLPTLRNGIFSILCVAAPLAVHLVITQQVLGGFKPDPGEIRQIALLPRTLPDLLAEFPARIDYGLAVVLFLIAAGLGLFYAVLTLRTRRGGRIASVALAISLLAGAVTFLADEHIRSTLCSDPAPDQSAPCGFVAGFERSVGAAMRDIAVTVIIERVREQGDALEPLIRHVLLLAAVTAGVGVAAVMALALRFAEIAWRAGDGPDPARALRVRWEAFRNSLVFGALILTLSVAATRSFYHWPLALLEDNSAEAYLQITTAAAGYWGAFYTLILLTIAVPAVISIHLDIDAEADAQKLTPAAQEKWRKDNNLVLAPREAISGMIAAAAPLLTSPALDALKSAF